MNAHLAPLRAQWQGLDRRVRVGLVGVLFAFVVLECWMLVLRAPLAEWRQLSAQRQVLAAGSDTEMLEAEVARQRQALAAAQATLDAARLSRSDDDLVLHLIATFDPLAARHGVRLGPVRAGARAVEGVLERGSVEVEVHGAYLGAMAWLEEAEAQAAPLQVGDLEIHTAEDGRQVAMRVKFVAYWAFDAARGAAR